MRCALPRARLPAILRKAQPCFFRKFSTAPAVAMSTITGIVRDYITQEGISL